MRGLTLFIIGGAALILFTGCQTPLPPGAEPGPHGTMAYTVLVEASTPGARIEANGNYIGEAPVEMKVFGDRDGTFHNFGSETFVVRAFPAGTSTNEHVQTRVFRTGGIFMPEDRIPDRVYFDMTQPPPVYVPVPVYVAPPSYYYGPSLYFEHRFYSRPYYYHRRPYYHGHSHHGGHGFKPPMPSPQHQRLPLFPKK